MKVINNNQINWYDDGKTRLSYQMLFEEEEEVVEALSYDPKELEEKLNERDRKWRNKLNIARDKAYQEGLEAGREEGLKQAREEIDAKINTVCTAVEKGHQEWQKRQKMMDPVLIELVFEITEKILGIPVEKEDMRAKLEEQLVPVLQKLDETSKPFVTVSEQDLDIVKRWIKENNPNLTVHLKSDPDCNPGEFEVDTQHETIVHKFREMFNEFKKNLSLPTWK
ncbi:FliH/SctL family protein [Gracilimonas mengyeensis]|uniref:Flagellar assembly protein FliH n=1 Tax=Gracilimonas mengyeensis TaxID=1302730 RepID=A0A521ECS3_9BACT|nr:FliH/SctL family protein [Gracilimonas mengyeensis]SMO81715.1 Flagellar biosynthesis/type III secretory pathway protein FliH [Gracilimonas mengyeensis]